MRKPDLFIVGAPKSGTTAMDDFLHQHPDVFMAKKEIHYFGSDLQIDQPAMSVDDYLDMFQDGSDKKIVGESSVWYLYSATAAQEIKAFSPEAKIIIMLRNPLDMIPAMHRQNLFDANENIASFEAAIAATEDRRAGRRLPKKPEHLACLMYTDAAKYYSQVKRYLDAFGSNVHIIIYDDFKDDNLKEYTKVLRFLEIDDRFIPKTDLINTAKKLRSQHLQQLVKRPPSGLRGIVRVLMPLRPVRHFIMQTMENYNVQKAGAAGISSEVKELLRKAYKDDIKKLSGLLHRDLGFWME